MPDTDPNQVRLTGEDPFIRLLDQRRARADTRQSLAHPLLPAGPGMPSSSRAT